MLCVLTDVKTPDPFPRETLPTLLPFLNPPSMLQAAVIAQHADTVHRYSDAFHHSPTKAPLTSPRASPAAKLERGVEVARQVHERAAQRKAEEERERAVAHSAMRAAVERESEVLREQQGQSEKVLKVLKQNLEAVKTGLDEAKQHARQSELQAIEHFVDDNFCCLSIF